jgi:hypothetical protein
MRKELVSLQGKGKAKKSKPKERRTVVQVQVPPTAAPPVKQVDAETKTQMEEIKRKIFCNF